MSALMDMVSEMVNVSIVDLVLRSILSAIIVNVHLHMS